jgi:hypothetical protein
MRVHVADASDRAVLYGIKLLIVAAEVDNVFGWN